MEIESEARGVSSQRPRAMNVYLSYVRADRALASQLATDLAREGISVWRDEDRLLPGDNIVENIFNAIRESTDFLALVSGNSARSPWFSSELATALASIEASPNRRIIPIIAERGAKLPAFLGQFQAVDLSSSDKYAEYLPHLLKSLKAEKFSGPPPPTDTLQRYEEVFPRVSERIFMAFEEQENYRRHLERSFKVRQRFGLALGASFIATLVIAGMLLLEPAVYSKVFFSFLGGLAVGIMFSVIFESTKRNHDKSSIDGERRG